MIHLIYDHITSEMLRLQCMGDSPFSHKSLEFVTAQQSGRTVWPTFLCRKYGTQQHCTCLMVRVKCTGTIFSTSSRRINLCQIERKCHRWQLGSTCAYKAVVTKVTLVSVNPFQCLPAFSLLFYPAKKSRYKNDVTKYKYKNPAWICIVLLAHRRTSLVQRVILIKQACYFIFYVYRNNLVKELLPIIAESFIMLFCWWHYALF